MFPSSRLSQQQQCHRSLAQGLALRPQLCRPRHTGTVFASVQEKSVALNPVEKVINALSVFVNTSPINEGKKRFTIGLAGQYDTESTKKFIEQSISNNKVLRLQCCFCSSLFPWPGGMHNLMMLLMQVVVFSWTVCPFARKAKQLLTDLGADFTAVELNQREDGKAIRAELAKVVPWSISLPDETPFPGCLSLLVILMLELLDGVIRLVP